MIPQAILGKLCICGSRCLGVTILEILSAVMRTDQWLEDYSDLGQAAILAALKLRCPQPDARHRSQPLTKFLLTLNTCGGWRALAAGYQEVSHRLA